jgi:hypothetical protein
MITRHEVLISLYGAWRLFLRDPRGIEWLDDTIDGYWKSFFCALLILPGYIILVAHSSGTLYADAGLFRVVSVEAISYVIGWVSWPLIMAYLAPALGCDHSYIRYIVAYNWSSGIQIVLYLAVMLFGVATQLPAGFAAFADVVLLLVVLYYHWFIVRVSLELSPWGAVGLVVGEYILGQFIRNVGVVLVLS